MRGLPPDNHARTALRHSIIEQVHSPDYGFEEWFLTAVMYPRVAGSGVLTFLQPTDQSVFLTQDIEYVTRADSNSEIGYYGDPVRSCGRSG